MGTIRPIAVFHVMIATVLTVWEIIRHASSVGLGLESAYLRAIPVPVTIALIASLIIPIVSNVSLGMEQLMERLCVNFVFLHV